MSSILYQAFRDTNFYSCYSSNLEKIQRAIENVSGKYSINSENKQQFIDSQYSPEAKRLAELLITNTHYITLQEVDEIIKQLVYKLYSENNNFENYGEIFMVVGKENKSTYFISVLAIKYIREFGFKEPIILNGFPGNFDDPSHSPILYFDDVCYSGSQIHTMLCKFYWLNQENEFPVLTRGRSELIKNTSLISPNIFVCLVALNTGSLNRLKFMPRIAMKISKIYYYDYEIESPFKLIYLEDRVYNSLINAIPLVDYLKINLLFSPNSLQNFHPLISLYLDHKIADPVSTYKNVLMFGVTPNCDKKYFNYMIDNPSSSDVPQFLVNEIISKLDEHEVKAIVGENIKEEISKSKDKKILNKYIDKIISEILKKCAVEAPETITGNKISFIPFLNSCNELLTSENLNTRFGDMDYLIFSGKIDYDLSEHDKELLKSIESIESCPTSWYKKGEFSMSCLAEHATTGGKNMKTRKIKKRKTNKRKTKRRKSLKKNKRN